MATPFLGEIRVTSFSFAPKGWALCNGQLLPIVQNTALFSLLGTYYGGDGRTTFALPNLQGRVPLHAGAGFVQGQQGGEDRHTVTLDELPAHTHTLATATDFANASLPAGALPAAKPRGGQNIYAPVGATTTLDPAAIGPSGGGQPHENRQPFLTLSFVISLQGIFPSRN
jgi:microcystin-dependent protein